MADSNNTVSALIAELQQLLEEERSILLSGSPGQITGVVARKLVVAEKIDTECQKSASAEADGEAFNRTGPLQPGQLDNMLGNDPPLEPNDRPVAPARMSSVLHVRWRRKRATDAEPARRRLSSRCCL
jgi:hypothetical protein